MASFTFYGEVKDGCIALPDNIQLADKTKVYVVVEDVETPRPRPIYSSRLVDAQAVERLRKTVVRRGKKEAEE